MTAKRYQYNVDQLDLDEDIRTAEWRAICAEAEKRQKVLEDFDPEEVLAHKRGYLAFKRVLDVILSLIVMIVFCWLYGIIAIAVKLDGTHGPVIFKQTRIGLRKDGRLKNFTIYKFRTMVPGAEDMLPFVLAMNEKTGPVFKIRNDPRVTRTGRVLRKMSLDELPQFVNVLKGELSIVGPRPALPSEVAQYTPEQRKRLAIKPGLTCYWQTRMNRDTLSLMNVFPLIFSISKSAASGRTSNLLSKP